MEDSQTILFRVSDERKEAAVESYLRVADHVLEAAWLDVNVMVSKAMLDREYGCRNECPSQKLPGPWLEHTAWSLLNETYSSN